MFCEAGDNFFVLRADRPYKAIARGEARSRSSGLRRAPRSALAAARQFAPGDCSPRRRARSMPSPSACLSIPGHRSVPPARAIDPRRAARARPARRDEKGSPPRCRGGMGQRCNSATLGILTVFRNLFELFHDRFRTPGRERSRLRSDKRGRPYASPPGVATQGNSGEL